MKQLPKAELVSSHTQKTTKCSVVKRGRGQYEISYQPTVSGVHQLHVRMGRQEVRGSPFLVSVKTTLEKLGTDIRTINYCHLPWGVTVNKSNQVIVANKIENVVSLFSPMGEKIRTLDTRNTVVGEMNQPRGVAVDDEDNILVVESGNCRLLKFSREGNLLVAVGKSNGPGQYVDPFGICVNSVNGKVYVVDYGADCVHILNSDLTFSSKFGSRGNGNGQFDYPYDVACDRSGCVYVADVSNNQVQVFTPDGDYLRQFGMEGSGNGKLKHPVSICVDSDDLVYVGESGNNRISVFTREGEFLKLFGSPGSRPGQFNSPIGITVDQCGVVYVSDFGNDRLQLFY